MTFTIPDILWAWDNGIECRTPDPWWAEPASPRPLPTGRRRRGWVAVLRELGR